MDRPLLKSKLQSITTPRVCVTEALHPDGPRVIYGANHWDPVRIIPENNKELWDEIMNMSEFQKFDIDFQSGNVLWKFMGCYAMSTSPWKVGFDHVEQVTS